MVETVTYLEFNLSGVFMFHMDWHADQSATLFASFASEMWGYNTLSFTWGFEEISILAIFASHCCGPLQMVGGGLVGLSLAVLLDGSFFWWCLSAYNFFFIFCIHLGKWSYGAGNLSIAFIWTFCLHLIVSDGPLHGCTSSESLYSKIMCFLMGPMVHRSLALATLSRTSLCLFSSGKEKHTAFYIYIWSFIHYFLPTVNLWSCSIKGFAFIMTRDQEATDLWYATSLFTYQKKFKVWISADDCGWEMMMPWYFFDNNSNCFRNVPF